MGYQVIWSDDAISDLRQAVQYIAQFNPDAAKKTGETILKKVQVLGQFPRLGKVFAKLGRDDVRAVPVPPYRVIYWVRDAPQTITILTVWHGARQEPDRLSGL
jgi:addiction module RelE/StbE family toxin